MLLADDRAWNGRLHLTTPIENRYLRILHLQNLPPRDDKGQLREHGIRARRPYRGVTPTPTLQTDMSQETSPLASARLGTGCGQ